MKTLTGLFLLLGFLAGFLNMPVQEDPVEIVRPRITVSFVPPGPIDDLEVSGFMFDTTVTFYGNDFTLTLQESGTVSSKKANINYESKVMAAACGEPRAYRQSDFVEWFTGVSGSTSSNPLTVNDFNACLLLSDGVYNAPDEEPEFSFTLMVPFYTFSGRGPVRMKDELVKTLRSFTFYDIDPVLLEPSDKEVPQDLIDVAKGLIQDPLDRIIDTDVVMTRDDEKNVEDIMNPTCRPNTVPSASPIINLGLVAKPSGIIRRDGYVPLSAKAEDIDLLHLFCQTVADCGEGSTWMHGMYSPTEISWKILSEEGSLVQVGCLPEYAKSATGENVILRPPLIFKPFETKTVRIQLTAKDLGNDTPSDNWRTKEIAVTFTGRKRPDNIEVDLEVEVEGELFLPQRNFEPDTDAAACLLQTEIKEIETLSTPVIKLPSIPDASSLVFGERLILEVEKQIDEDHLVHWCSSICGESGPKTLVLHDDLLYQWQITKGNGYFEVGDQQLKTVQAQSVVYRAPDEEHYSDKVTISVKAMNRPGIFQDRESASGEITLDIFQPAIKVDELPANWLPEYMGELPVATKLVVYKSLDSDTPVKPAFSHVSTLFNYELTEISNYEGVCTNFEDPANPEHSKLDLFFDLIPHRNWFIPLQSDPLDPSRMTYLKSKEALTAKEDIKPVISLRDYGAHAQLKLRHVDQEHWDVINEIYPIPYDFKKNHIADHLIHSQMAASTTETLKDDDFKASVPAKNAGDGFTIWEEYRGFMVCKDATCTTTEHRRTHPDKRDLFIYSELTYLTFDLFEKAADVTVHSISRDQMDENRVVNFITENGRMGLQYGLIIIEGLPSSGTIWETLARLQLEQLFGEEEADLIIETADWMVETDESLEDSWLAYYTSFLRQNAMGKTQKERGVSDTGSYIPKEVKHLVITEYKIQNSDFNMEEVVAHELGHAVGVPHHSDKDPTQKISLLYGDGNCREVPHITNDTKFSGNMACIMRYNYPAAIGTLTGNNITECESGDKNKPKVRQNLGQIRDDNQGWTRPDGTLVRRDKFCKDKGPNSPYGRITASGRGNCYNRIKVKCW